jgi:ElaB/YqjD/DUF883 family membrane-anchored ribosome-binding protein
MDNEPEEMIKHQMLETRASLAEKLETLEQQVVGTVQSATNAVAHTVESVKEAVQETVEIARSSVHDTVEAVKETFDLAHHVRAHPWAMLGGSVVAGYVGGYVLERSRSAAGSNYPEAAPSLSTLAAHPEADRDRGLAGGAVALSARHGRLKELGERFDTEITRLKGLALGTMLGLARDMVVSSAPPQLGPELAEIIDSATVKLGGKPIEGPVLGMFQGGSAWQGSARHGQNSQETDPWGATPSPSPGAAGTID